MGKLFPSLCSTYSFTSVRLSITTESLGLLVIFLSPLSLLQAVLTVFVIINSCRIFGYLHLPPILEQELPEGGTVSVWLTIALQSHIEDNHTLPPLATAPALPPVPQR
jgi:hypothetical protein